MTAVATLHSFVRFVLLAAMLVGLVRAVYTQIRQTRSGTSPQTMDALYIGLFDLQALLGLLVILLGGFVGPLHPLVMFIALVIAHWIQSILRNASPTSANQLRLALYGVPLGIIAFGLAIIGQIPV